MWRASIVALLVGCGATTAPAAEPEPPVTTPPAAAPPAAEAPEAAPASICAIDASADDCAHAALAALASGDAEAALLGAYRACNADRAGCAWSGALPTPGTAGASDFVAVLAERCADGWAPACTLRPLGAMVRGDAEAECATGEPYACDVLATLLVRGYGVAADRDAAARVSDRTSYGVRALIAEAGGTLLGIPLAEPPARIAASVVPCDDGTPREGTFVGWDGSHSHCSVGLPALSADGRLVAVVRSDGDANNGEVELLSLDAESGAVVRADPISESHAGEEETEVESARWAATRRAVSTVSRYLARRGFRSLTRAPSPDEPAVGGVPILDWSGYGWVTLRDPSSGRVLFSEQMVVPDPDPPDLDALDEEAFNAWWVEHACDVSALDDAAAWSIDATHVLVMTRVNPTPDECTTSTEHTIVTLATE